jgi:hypothetical protein
MNMLPVPALSMNTRFSSFWVTEAAQAGSRLRTSATFSAFPQQDVVGRLGNALHEPAALRASGPCSVSISLGRLNPSQPVLVVCARFRICLEALVYGFKDLAYLAQCGAQP